MKPAVKYSQVEAAHTRRRHAANTGYTGVSAEQLRLRETEAVRSPVDPQRHEIAESIANFAKISGIVVPTSHP